MNPLNQYTAVPQAPSAPSFDQDGNMETGPLPVSPGSNSTLVWDAENRLIEVKSGTGTGATSLVTYAYDHLSRLVVRTTTAAAPGGATVTRYLYDGWNRIAEYSGQTLQKSYIWGMDLSGSMQGAGGVGGLLAMRLGTTGGIYYPTYDGNGNITEYLAYTGSVAAHIEYDPFGNLAGGTAPSDQFAFRFSTKPVDPVTGLYYYGYRWYDPLTGRWPSRDPIGERGGVNLYGFVGNDGINWLDWLGLLLGPSRGTIAIENDHVHQDTGSQVIGRFGAELWKSPSRPGHCALFVEFRVRLVFVDNLGNAPWTAEAKEKYTADFSKEVSDSWGEQWKLKPLGQSKSCCCDDISVYVDIVYSENDPHWTILVNNSPKAANREDGRSNVSPRERKVNLGMSDNYISRRTYSHKVGSASQVTSSHEVGHMLGLRDEYAESDRRLEGYERDEDSIMNKGDEVRERHYKPFVDFVNKVTKDGCVYEATR